MNNWREFIDVILFIILVPLIPFSYWLGSFMKDNKIRAWLSNSKFKDTDYREWKEYIKENK